MKKKNPSCHFDSTLPRHLAIIMDGNGRWAQARKKRRVFGHVKGTRVAKDVIQNCARRGVQYLTLYAFSTENWLRPQHEVDFLMLILQRYLKRETENLIKENISFDIIGERHRLPDNIRKQIETSIERTKACTGMKLIFALSYGSRQEITWAVRRIAAQIKQGTLNADEIDEARIHQELWTQAIPDPDLILRTSGEKRLSNFLLWQCAYSEFHFSDVLWPDFNSAELDKAFAEYALRERRFGKVNKTDEQLRY